MSAKESYWNLFDHNQQIRLVPDAFIDQFGYFNDTARQIMDEMERSKEIPIDSPDAQLINKQDIARVDKEAKDLHWELNYSTTINAPSALENVCRQITKNGDACAVYHRLPKRDQERIIFKTVKNMVGKATYALEAKPAQPRNPYVLISKAI